MPAQVERNYNVTWNGQPKLCIGIGGINYNLRVGDPVFGWVNGDRAEPGVATDNTGKDPWKAGYRTYASVGNEVTMVDGEAKGALGVVIGKHGYRLPGGVHHVLIQFDETALEKLAIGDKVLIKACGVGLQITGFDDVKVRSVAPELLEQMDIKVVNDTLIVPVVKEIPHHLLGEGWGSQASLSHIGIQTCYPPDIKEYGLHDLRFGDVVMLKDLLSDFGRGYYRGGATIGVVCSGPSDIAGRGIGVTTILSTRTGRLAAKLDPDANIGNYLALHL
jgi:hypothetical protein